MPIVEQVGGFNPNTMGRGVITQIGSSLDCGCGCAICCNGMELPEELSGTITIESGTALGFLNGLVIPFELGSQGQEAFFYSGAKNLTDCAPDGSFNMEIICDNEEAGGEVGLVGGFALDSLNSCLSFNLNKRWDITFFQCSPFRLEATLTIDLDQNEGCDCGEGVLELSIVIE